MAVAATAQVERSGRGVTFVVDENLPAPEDEHQWKISGDRLAGYLLRKYDAANVDSGCVASSFACDSLISMDKDVFYRCFVKAYAEHRPLVLSPDAVWLNICQVFSRYVNDNSAKLRKKIVRHKDGQMTLVVKSDKDLLSGQADWQAIMDGFMAQIDADTKGDVAKKLVADFSTTGTAERIASGITIMDAMKSYFEYVVFYISCGIPSITLTGTPDDWQSLLDKTMALNEYGMGWWTKDLKPILEEFVRASKGEPDRAFWKNIVMRDRPDRLRGGGCTPEQPTVFDGWFLKLFPYNKDGKLADRVATVTDMMAGMVKVPFRYIIAGTGAEKEIPMELWAGFVGAEKDNDTGALTPKIGWMVRVSDGETDILNRMEKQGFTLRVREVPPVLAKLSHIKRLELYFIDKVVLPEWMDNIRIDKLVINGKLSGNEAEQIRKRFPKVSIRNR